MAKRQILYTILFICITALGCRKDNFSLFSVKSQLTKNKWVMKSLSDYGSNTDFPVSNTTYEFKSDGTYIITPSSIGSPIYSTWELIDHKQYLKIGNNTFRISYLSGKLLGLRYGDLALFYVPVEK